MNYTWLFAAGINSYLSQLTKYCNKVNFMKGGKMHTIKFPHTEKIIDENYECVKFSEIDTDYSSHSLFENFLARMICNIKHSYNNISSNGYYYFIDIKKLNIGQEEDIKKIHEHYQNIETKYVIGYGVSRGAMALINWVGKCKPKKIKALILEGTPTDLNTIEKHSLEWYNKIYYMGVKFILPYISSYNPNSYYSKANVLDLPKDLPILFITSLNDKMVPYNCTLEMYNNLLNNGYTRCKIVILKKPHHDNYLTDNEEDRITYLSEVNNFLLDIEEIN